jgi:pyruvate dehydrogenase E2 component (dihydrolipoamide acetyltransferase)
MARWEFKLPDVGEGVTEGEIVEWLVSPGDVVVEDQPMTDKATVTITAPKAGTVLETRGSVGETVPVQSVLAVFELHDSPGGTPAHTNGADKLSRTEDEPAAMAVGQIHETLPGMSGGAAAGLVGRPLPPGKAARNQGYFNEKPLATPATRKLAREMNVDLRHVPPTGPSERVTRADVESFDDRPKTSAGAAAPEATIEGAHVSAPAPVMAPRPPGGGPRTEGTAAHAAVEDRVPLAGLRRKIAQRMTLSTATAAHFTFVEECDVTELKAVRARLVGPAAAAGVKLSFLPFVVKAVVASLKKHPILNTTLDEATNEIVFRRYYNIGIATATEAGLVVPVVKGADQRSILDIAREIERLSEDARAGKAKLDDLHGSTFTITSLGARGGLLATPIINFPEVAILGVHQIKAKPVVRGGQIAIGDVMLLSLSLDHRIVDGHIGAAFAYEIIGYLENPERLLLEMV